MQLGSLDRQTLSLHPGDEPIAGFRLIRCRGRGGFGEVWEAEAPGQFIVALKFVRLSSQGRVAELRALDFVRGIHHPNLLANFGSWQIGETLVIGMELADGSLWDRFLEATQIGDRGIPRGELLGYLSDVAAGVDHLNGYSHTVEGRSSMGVQHRDLKPPNILLFGGGAKVADLGMARAMEGEVAGHTGVWTFPYAAPEFFRGETTRQSDQYGLAVTYCQLRGGRLPFGGNAASVTAGHLFAEPNLDALPEAERPIVARALAKGPGDRWPNCRAFVDALRALPGDALPDRLVGPADLADLSDESLILASGDSHFVPNDSGSGLMAIQSGWLPDTADSGSAFAVMPGALSSDHVSSAPLVGHDFSLWSSFEAKLVLPADPANSWVDDGSLPRNRPARSLLRRVGTASLLGFALVAVATSGFQSEPQAGQKSADSPLVATRVTAPSVALTDEAGVELPTPPGTETITQPDPESVILATSPIGRAEIKSEESLSPVSTDEATRSSPDVVDLQTALDTSPVVVPEVRPGLMLEGPREMGDSPPFALATIPDRVQPAPPAQVPRPPAPVTSNPPTPRIASTAPVVNPSQDQALRRTRISLADLGQADPVPAEAAYARGRELFRRSDFLGAIRAFDEAIRLNPGHATSHFARAITRDRAGDPRAALADYAEVIRARPEDAAAYLSRGQIHHELGEYDQAIVEFDRAIQLRPDAADPRFRRGLARFRVGDNAGAADDFAATLQLDPKHTYAAGFRDESLARYDAKLGQVADGPPQSAPRVNPAELPTPLRETNYLAPPPAGGSLPGARPSGTRPAPSTAPTQRPVSPAKPTKRRVPVVRRLIPWPFLKPK